VGHGLARHPERGMLRALGWRWLLSGLFGSTSFGPESLQTLLVLAYTRDDERAADRRAVMLLERAGIRSDGLPKFLERIAADPQLNGNGTPGFLASHPSPAARARELRALVNPEIRGTPWSSKEWNAIQNLCGKPKSSKQRKALA